MLDADTVMRKGSLTAGTAGGGGGAWEAGPPPLPRVSGDHVPGLRSCASGGKPVSPRDRFTLRKTEVGKATPLILSFLKPYGPKQELLLPQHAGLD